MFNELSDDSDKEMAIVDGTIVTTHRATHGARGGLCTKLTVSSKEAGRPRFLSRTDTLGNLVRFVLLPGNPYDTAGADPSSALFAASDLSCSKPLSFLALGPESACKLDLGHK